jgi:hypothetical protein
VTLTTIMSSKSAQNNKQIFHVVESSKSPIKSNSK